MINISNLNPALTYVCNEVGRSAIAKIIQKLSYKIYKKIKPENIASHTFVLRYKNNRWNVWENHLKWGGIREYPLSEYLNINQKSGNKNIITNPCNLDLNSMDYWKKYNPGYSVLNLFEICEERLIGLKLPDTKGWVCSQAVAALNFDICLKLGKPFEQICPVDWQVFFQQ